MKYANAIFSALLLAIGQLPMLAAGGDDAKRLKFPADRSLGSLYTLATTLDNGRDTDNMAQYLAPAKGEVAIPNGGRAVELVVNAAAIRNPQLLDSVNSKGLKAIKITVAAMEKGDATAGSVLAHIGGLTGLELLNLDRSDACDADIEKLPVLKSLKSISLFCAPISGHCFPSLKRFPELALLEVDNCPLEKEYWKFLPELPSLTELRVSTTVSDSELTQISKCKKLRVLHLGHGLTDKNISILRDLPNLEQLHIKRSQVTLAGISKLRGMHLAKLQLGQHSAAEQMKLKALFPNCNIHCDSRVVDSETKDLFAPISRN